MPFNRFSFGCVALITAVISSFSLANEDDSNIKKAEAVKAAHLRMENVRLPKDMNLSLWADETQTRNSGFFTFDSKGRMLITELNRIGKGVDDIRGYPEMTVEDIYIQSSEDRLKMFANHAANKPLSTYEGVSDYIRLLDDTDGDGRADRSLIFAEGFDQPLDGIASGLLERDGKVYFTNIPHLWMLEDKNDDGVADSRESLQDGFGIRMSFFGHDMHGLVWGPDGKMYWSIGDRGFSFVSKEGKRFHGPNLGGVFRADPDGSNIELFYTGLRNPQELAFDQYGNLFTADNDGDAGDVERVNHLIEGGESGWTAGEQSIMSFTSRLKLRSHAYTGKEKIYNPWLTHDMWKPRNDNQPAYILPAIVQVDGGPSGFVYNPSNSMGEAWNDTYFLALYKGTPAKTNITTFKTKPHGASFLTDKPKIFLSGINLVDVDFGPDGKLYISEFNYGGWNGLEQGAVFTVEPKNVLNQSEIEQAEKILTTPFTGYSTETLRSYLSHRHMQVRQRAQFELAKESHDGAKVFHEIAFDQSEPLLARLHSIWGLGQIARRSSAQEAGIKKLTALQSDNEAQVRVQVTRVLGDLRFAEGETHLIQALDDSHAQVVMYAAIGLGRLGSSQAVPKIISLLEQNNDQDLWLRHAYVMALFGSEKAQWIKYKNHKSESVRMGVLLALRKLHDEDIAFFLNDQAQRIVDEAIIAINDRDIRAARSALAKHLDRYISAKKIDLPKNDVQRLHHHRLINANYNEGTAVAAQRLLNYARNPQLEKSLVSEALAAIEAWHDVNPIDTITGLPTTANATREPIQVLVSKALPKLLKKAKGQVLVQAMRIADKNKSDISDDVLASVARDTASPINVREQALTTLHTRKAKGLQPLVKELLEDSTSQIRGVALKILFDLSPELGMDAIEKVLASGTNVDQQKALNLLNGVESTRAQAIALKQLKLLIEGSANPHVNLEIITLANSIENSELKSLLAAHLKSLESASPELKFSGALHGGDIQRGRQIFEAGGAADCFRCHVINGRGGKAGPDLSDVGLLRDRQYLLRALVDPGAEIAPGFGVISAVLKNGNSISGLYLAEDEDSITVKLPNNSESKINKSTIEELKRPASGMPPMNYLLSEYEIRDLISYLSTLKGTEQSKGGH